MFDPWQIIKRYPHLTVHTTRLVGSAGSTDGVSTIWLDDRLTAIERRCVLTHELLHVGMGHKCHQLDGVETQVRERTARALVPLHLLLARRLWDGPLDYLAEELHVTEDVLADRLRWILPGERARLVTGH